MGLFDSALSPIGAIGGAVSGLTSLGIGIAQNIKAQRDSRIEAAKERKWQKKLEMFEKNRQEVIDQSEDIRALKSQVFNPYANLAVATQASNLQIEQTDEALANTLDAINRSGTGAGAASALARMAASSKAQIGASLENQEVKNQQLRMQGEANMVSMKMGLEQAALAEETAAWGRQEGRDLATMDRLAGLQDNARQAAMAHQMGGQQALMGGASGFAQGMGTFAAGMKTS